MVNIFKAKFDLANLKENFVSLLLSIYMLLSFGSLFLNENLRLLVMILISLFGLLLALFSLINNATIRLNRSSFKYVFALIVFYVLVQLVHSKSPFSVVFPLSSCLMAFMLLYVKLVERFLYVSFLIIAILFSLFFLKGIDPNEIFNGASRNLISVIMLMNVALINFVEYKNGKLLSIWPGFIGVLFSVWAVGRSGIFCSVSLFFIVIFYHFWKSSFRKRFLFFLLCLLILAAFIFYMGRNVDVDLFSLFFRFSDRGIAYEDDGRGLIFDAYISKIDFFSFLFGYDYLKDSYLTDWPNLHNSFLSLHSFLGIGAFIIYGYVLFSLFSLLNTDKPLFFIFLILLIRIFFDAICFNGLYDFLIISFLLYAYRRNDELYLNLQDVI